MRSALAGALVLAFALPAPAGAAGTARGVLAGDALAELAAAEEVIVALEADAHAALLVGSAGGELLSADLRLWSLPGVAAARLVQPLERRGALRYAEVAPRRDELVHFTDPLTTPEIGWHLSAVGASTVEPPGPGFPLTVIDSGIDLGNPDFAGRPDVIALNPQSVRNTRDREYHGTAVAAIAAAATNGVGTEGVYPRATIRSYDLGGDLSDPNIILGIMASVAAGPSVISLSLGGPENTRALYEATQFALGRGSLVVASSGNEFAAGNPPIYPAAYPHVLTVASVGRTNEPSPFSSGGRAVDLAAPGEALPVALPGGGHLLVSGTSFAAPIVAAAAAWIQTARGPMQPKQLADLIRWSARDVGEPGFDTRTGFGLLDLPAALTRPVPAVDPQEPNDDVDQVVAGGLFDAPKRLVSSRFRARVDVTEDPHDVYRVSVGANQRLTIVVTPEDDVRTALYGPTARTILGTRARVAFSDRAGRAIERLVYTNATRRPAVVFLHVRPGAAGTTPNRAYAVAITRASVPR